MIINSIKRRRSFRTYKSDPVSDEMVGEIIKAAQFAPTAYGKSAIEFVVVRRQETKDALFEVVEQEYVKEAPVLIVPVATEEAVLPVQDLSVASAHIFLQATELGLGSVWKNFNPEREEKVKEILSIPDGCKMVNLIPIGFPAEEKSEHSDEEFKIEKIHQERWQVFETWL